MTDHIHCDKHDLHGMTVVVDTGGSTVFVGRCDDMNDEKVILRDVASHEAGEGGTSKEEFVEKSAQFGFWAKIPHIEIPTSEVTAVRLLSDISVS